MGQRHLRLRSVVTASACALAACSLLNPLDGFSDGMDGGASNDEGGAATSAPRIDAAGDAKTDAAIDAAIPTPLSVGDPRLWFAADQGVTVASMRVSKWADQSSGHHDATPPAAANQPTLAENALNGKPALAFDGTSATLSFSVAIEGLTGITFVAVSASGDPMANGGNNLSLGTVIHWDETTAWGTTFLGAFQGNVGGRFGTTQENNTLDALRAPGIGSAFTLTIMEHDTTTDRIWADGKLVVLETGKKAAIGGTAAGAEIGSGDFGTYFTGSIAEIIVYPFALGDMKRSVVQAYIHAKYFPDRPVF